MRLRIGYNYPILLLNKNPRDIIFEICYCPKNHEWWTDITPDFRRTKWRKISDRYSK
jgi:hypothetical protein